MELADFLKMEEEGKEPIDGETIRVLRESIEENEVTMYALSSSSPLSPKSTRNLLTNDLSVLPRHRLARTLRSKQQERSKMFLIAMQNQLGIDAASSHYSIAASSSGRNTVEGSRSGDRIQRNMMMGGTGGEGMEMEVESDAIANQREEEVTRGAGDELVLDPSDVNPEEEEGIYL